jgi:hypothetical protein
MSVNKILLFLFASVVATQAISLEIKIAYQKVTEKGRPYGAPGGIYFKIKNIEPFLPYWVQYSHDLKKWEDLYNFGSFGLNSSSPLFHWYELPPGKCFFRIIQKY